MLALRNRFPSTNLMRVFDDLFDPSVNNHCDYDFEVDVKENDDEFIVTAEIPGINKDDISVTLENNVLAIEFTKKEEKTEKTSTYHLKERRTGKYSRAFKLPTNVDNTIDAVLKDGVLSLNIKKSETSKRKLIEIKTT